MNTNQRNLLQSLALAGFMAGAMAQSHAADPLKVGNVTFAQQQPGPADHVKVKKVNIQYDVSGGIPPYNITLMFSADGGAYQAATSLEGAYGPNQSAGTNKVITWDAEKDWDKNYSANMKFKVTADDDPKFVASPASIALQVEQGKIGTSTMEVWNEGGGLADFTLAASDPSWISCSPPSGTATSTHQAILLSFNATSLSVGQHQGSISVRKSADNSEQVVIPFIITVVDPPSIVINGDFEYPDASGTPTYYAGQSFGGWTVDSGDVNHVDNDIVRLPWPGWLAASGSQSVDLTGQQAGAIYQDLFTLGQSYLLGFHMAGNPSGGPSVMTMEVWWGSTLVDTVSFDTTGHSISNMGWNYHAYTVTAYSPLTRLNFKSLTGGVYGPTLDNVAVRNLK